MKRAVKATERAIEICPHALLGRMGATTFLACDGAAATRIVKGVCVPGFQGMRWSNGVEVPLGPYADDAARDA